MIRPAQAGDVDALVRLENDSFDVYPIARARFARLIGHASRPLLVFEDAGGALLGYVSVIGRRGVPQARIFSIAVAAAARGRGVGRALLAAANTAAQALHCTSIRLEVEESNSAARALYASAGYEIVRTETNYYGPGRSAVVYLRQLR